MSNSVALQNLMVDYSVLAHNPPRYPTADQERSMLFYREELAHDETRTSPSLGRISKWMTTARDLHRFVNEHGRLPRENNRVPRNAIPERERQLADWVRYQRRPASVELLCDFQKSRLEAIPGFLWNPRGSLWDERFDEFTRFVSAHHRAPRYRSTDPIERNIAAWATKQRQLVRQGKLSERRTKKLASLFFGATDATDHRTDH